MLTSHVNKKPSIGLTPLIDVVFILLIFFMLVMQFQQFQQSTLPLSDTSQSGVRQDKTLSLIVIDEKFCELESVTTPCTEILEKISVDKVESVAISYSDSTDLYSVMYWLDRFSGVAADVSLAVKVDEGKQ